MEDERLSSYDSPWCLINSKNFIKHASILPLDTSAVFHFAYLKKNSESFEYDSHLSCDQPQNKANDKVLGQAERHLPTLNYLVLNV